MGKYWLMIVSYSWLFFIYLYTYFSCTLVGYVTVVLLYCSFTVKYHTLSSKSKRNCLSRYKHIMYVFSHQQCRLI